MYRKAIHEEWEIQEPQVLERGLESCARCAGFSMMEIGNRKEPKAFAKRARLPQAEDSAPMRVSRTGRSPKRLPRRFFREAVFLFRLY